MKSDKAIEIEIRLAADGVRDAINQEDDLDRQCRLQDANEYLRRAWCAITGVTTEDNTTTIEASRKAVAS